MKTLSLSLLSFVLLALVPLTSSAQSKFNPVQAFSTLKASSQKFMDEVKPWNDKLKANEAMVPAKVKPSYDSFNKALDAYNSKLGTAAKNPSKFTAAQDKSMTSDLGKLQSQFKDLQGMTGSSMPDMPMKGE